MKARTTSIVSALWRCAAVLVALGAVAGCRTGSVPSASDAPVPTAAQLRELDQAEEILVARCMRAQGFEYHLVTADPATRDERAFPYGIDDPAWASRHGLGLAARAEASRLAGPDNPNNRYTDSLDPQRRRNYSTALFGTETRLLKVTIPTGDVVSAPVNGCLATARSELYGDLRRWFPAKTITGNLAGAIQPRVYADPRFRQAAAEWSRCMAGRGHDYRDPPDLRARSQKASPKQEREVATAEAGCVQESRLAAVGARLDRELGAPVRATYSADVRSCRMLQAAALPRAAELIRNYPTTEASG